MARRFQRRSNSHARKMVWGNGITSGQTFTLAVNTAILHAAVDFRLAANNGIIGGTIIRTRGAFGAVPATITTDVEAFGAIGVGIVSGEAFDAGIASLPSPIAEGEDSRWLYHRYWNTMARVDDFSAGNATNIGFGASFEIDSKAMRKIGQNDVLVEVIEAGAGLVSARVYWNERHLFKLP